MNANSVGYTFYCVTLTTQSQFTVRPIVVHTIHESHKQIHSKIILLAKFILASFYFPSFVLLCIVCVCVECLCMGHVA